jgi:diguanylate cyclase (GGDEF)-like protein
MDGAVSRTTAGRVAAALFLLSGALTVLSLALPAPPTLDAGKVALVGAVSMAAAVPVWLVPWQHWPRWTSLSLVVFALPLISFHNIVGGSDPYRWGIFYVVLAAWVGLAHPRGTFVLLSPLVAASYALPLVIFPDHPFWSLSSTLYAVPVCCLVSESVAWAIDRAARAQWALQASEARLRDMAHHDALTGLSNRTDFLLQLESALDRARLLRRGIAVLFLDIDEFKGINDRLGHAAGDELLRHVAACLRAAVRPEDVAARLGGDEFTVLLADVSSSDDAMRVAERIHTELKRPHDFHSGAAVNASIGVVLARPDDSPDSLLRRADAAMYEAKRGGKGRAALLDLAA